MNCGGSCFPSDAYSYQILLHWKNNPYWVLAKERWKDCRARWREEQIWFVPSLYRFARDSLDWIGGGGAPGIHIQLWVGLRFTSRILLRKDADTDTASCSTVGKLSLSAQAASFDRKYLEMLFLLHPLNQRCSILLYIYTHLLIYR